MYLGRDGPSWGKCISSGMPSLPNIGMYGIYVPPICRMWGHLSAINDFETQQLHITSI